MTRGVGRASELAEREAIFRGGEDSPERQDRRGVNDPPNDGIFSPSPVGLWRGAIASSVHGVCFDTIIAAPSGSAWEGDVHLQRRGR